MAWSARVRRSPDELSALTSTRRLSLSIAATTLAIDSAEASDGGWPCTSIAGKLRLRHGMRVGDERGLRAVVDDARRRRVRRLTATRTRFGRAGAGTLPRA